MWRGLFVGGVQGGADLTQFDLSTSLEKLFLYCLCWSMGALLEQVRVTTTVTYLHDSRRLLLTHTYVFPVWLIAMVLACV